MDERDKYAWQVHRQDQITAELRNVGGWHAAYFRGLLEGGLSRQEALTVTCAYVTAVVGHPPEPLGDDAW